MGNVFLLKNILVCILIMLKYIKNLTVVEQNDREIWSVIKTNSNNQ